jgi:hypothetical protein
MTYAPLKAAMAYFFLLSQTRRIDTSIRETIEGDALFNAHVGAGKEAACRGSLGVMEPTLGDSLEGLAERGLR